MCKPSIICYNAYLEGKVQELFLYPFSSQRNVNTYCVIYGNCPFHLFVENLVLYILVGWEIDMNSTQ